MLPFVLAYSSQDRIALVHNGVITNSEDLKKRLEAKGIIFKSETDTEVIAQLVTLTYFLRGQIGDELDSGKSVLDAIKGAESKLEGTWGVVLISKGMIFFSSLTHNLSSDHPEELYAFKNGSPLLVGISKGRMWVASEPAAFSQSTKEYIALEVPHPCS